MYAHYHNLETDDVMTKSIQLTTNVPKDLHIPIALEFSDRIAQGLAMAITI